MPDYRIETSLYAALPSLASLYGRAAIDNLHDRVGESALLFGNTDVTPRKHAVWARAFSWRGDHQGGELGIYSKKGPDFEFSLDGLQGGLQLLRPVAGAVDSFGVYGAAGRATAEVDHIRSIPAGEARLEAYSLGVSWTRVWDAGAYMDGVVQGTRYEAATHSSDGVALNGDTQALAASLEAAWPIPLGKSWVLEPQGQFTYQHLYDETLRDAFGVVHLDAIDSLVGRLGLRAARLWWVDKGGVERPAAGWLRLNVSHEFIADPTVTFDSDGGPVVFNSTLGHWWSGLEAGGSYPVARTTIVYGHLGYTRTIDDNVQAFTLKLGVRIGW